MFRLRPLTLLVVCLTLAGCKSDDKDDGNIIHSPNPDAFARVLRENRVVLVDFQATWCGPCKRMKPIIRELEKDYRGKVAVVEVDVDAQPQLADQYDVRGIPLFLVFRDGKVADAISGAVLRAQLVQALEKQLRAAK